MCAVVLQIASTTARLPMTRRIRDTAHSGQGRAERARGEEARAWQSVPGMRNVRLNDERRLNKRGGPQSKMRTLRRTLIESTDRHSVPSPVVSRWLSRERQPRVQQLRALTNFSCAQRLQSEM